MNETKISEMLEQIGKMIIFLKDVEFVPTDQEMKIMKIVFESLDLITSSKIEKILRGEK